MNAQEKTGPALLSIIVSLIAGCGSGEVQDVENSRPGWNLVLVTVDTYRADHFLQDRAGVQLTPNLNLLAERSIIFSNAASAANCTSPGTAAILTGLLPKTSGVVNNGHQLPGVLPTLTSELDSAGYTTAAFIGNPVLAAGHGFDRGFEKYILKPTKGPQSRTQNSSRPLSDAAVKWLRELSGQRFFLWVHYMDPHGPYRPPDSHRALFPKDEFEGAERIPLLPRGDNSGKGGIPYYQHQGKIQEFGDGRDFAARYAAEVRVMDDKVGVLLNELDRLGLMERSILVLTSDHGEALAGDHGFYFSHAHGVTQDQVHVPLLLYYPGCESGRTIDRPVSTVDIFPTVQELLGLDLPTRLDGSHLLGEEARYVVSQSARGSAIREGRWKLVRGFGRAPHLVDLSSDLPEAENLAGANPEQLSRLSRRLDELERLPQLTESMNRELPTSKVERELRALGYGGEDEEDE